MSTKFEEHAEGDIIFVRPKYNNPDGVWRRVRIESVLVDSDGDIFGTWIDDSNRACHPVYFNVESPCYNMDKIINDMESL